jgi:hypothetical protein
MGQDGADKKCGLSEWLGKDNLNICAMIREGITAYI